MTYCQYKGYPKKILSEVPQIDIQFWISQDDFQENLRPNWYDDKNVLKFPAKGSEADGKKFDAPDKEE